MRRLIGALPVWIEAFIVLAGAFGLPMLSSVMALIDPANAPAISEVSLRRNLIYEPAVFVVLAAFLWLRGWTITRIGLRYQGLDALLGLALMMVSYAVFIIIFITIGAFGYDTEAISGANLVAGNLSLGTVIGASVVNALFEEVFVCGYPIVLAKEHSRLIAGVNLSVAVRLAYHLYQGGGAVISILPLGLICAWFFAKTGRLWPLVIGHVVIDLVGLMHYVN